MRTRRNEGPRVRMNEGAKVRMNEECENEKECGMRGDCCWITRMSRNGGWLLVLNQPTNGMALVGTRPGKPALNDQHPLPLPLPPPTQKDIFQ